jgi:hypothetical protein
LTRAGDSPTGPALEALSSRVIAKHPDLLLGTVLARLDGEGRVVLTELVRAESVTFEAISVEPEEAVV